MGLVFMEISDGSVSSLEAYSEMFEKIICVQNLILIGTLG